MPINKSTSLSKKKSNIFNNRNILVGIIFIALVGIVAVFVSQASEGENVPVQEYLFCKQGKCYETPMPGAQRSENKVWVRAWSAEDNANPDQDCSATDKEWATIANRNKQAPKYWVCVEAGDPNALPDGYQRVNSPCYSFPARSNGLVEVVGTGLEGSTCLNTYRYALPSAGDNSRGSSISVDSEFSASTQNYAQLAESERNRFVSLGQSVSVISDRYKPSNGTTVGGKPIKVFQNNTTKDLYVFVDYAPTKDANATVKNLKTVYIKIYGYAKNGQDGTYIKNSAKTALSRWQWK